MRQVNNFQDKKKKPTIKYQVISSLDTTVIEFNKMYNSKDIAT